MQRPQITPGPLPVSHVLPTNHDLLFYGQGAVATSTVIAGSQYHELFTTHIV